ncbi:MAG: hypothetical protein M3394_08450 [Actinomycetota bacterium]|nr:hypothetical protein [Actinomycetota bacterium]
MEVVLFVVFAAVGVLGSLYFLFDGDTRRKERFHPPFVIGSGLLFVVVVTVDRSAGALLLTIPGVAVITWLNLRNIRFCHACGRTTWNTQWWQAPPRFCIACGTPFEVRA